MSGHPYGCAERKTNRNHPLQLTGTPVLTSSNPPNLSDPCAEGRDAQPTQSAARGSPATNRPSITLDKGRQEFTDNIWFAHHSVQIATGQRLKRYPKVPIPSWPPRTHRQREDTANDVHADTSQSVFETSPRQAPTNDGKMPGERSQGTSELHRELPRKRLSTPLSLASR